MEEIKFDVLKQNDYTYRIMATVEGKDYIMSGLSFGCEDKAWEYINLHEKELIKKFKPRKKSANNKKKEVKKNNKDEFYEITYPNQDSNLRFFAVKDENDLYEVYILIKDINYRYILENEKFSEVYYAEDYVRTNAKYLEKKANEIRNDKLLNNNYVSDNNSIECEEEYSQEERDTKKGGIIAIFAAGALAGITTAAILLTSCPSGCKGKGTKNATDKNNAIVINTSTPRPTAAIDDQVTLAPSTTPYVTPAQTVMPTEVVDTITIEVLENKSNEILDSYMKINPEISNMEVVSDGQLIGYTVTSEDIERAIIILNSNSLSLNNYNVFREYVSDKNIDALYQQNEFFMCNIIALNIKNYYMDNASKFISLSPLLLNENDRKDMEYVEELVKSGNVSQLIDVLDNQKMLNRGNGFDKILVMYLEYINNTRQNSMSSNTRNRIRDIKSVKQESSYVGIMNMLKDAKNDYGCFIDSTLVRTRHC